MLQSARVDLPTRFAHASKRSQIQHTKDSATSADTSQPVTTDAMLRKKNPSPFQCVLFVIDERNRSVEIQATTDFATTNAQDT